MNQINNNRTHKAMINSLAGIIGYFFSMLANIIFRTVFIYFLSIEYLGISAILTNILSLLSLAEMGIGSAMTFSLYKPLANNDKNKINALLVVYKKVYRGIALLISVAGLLLIPYLDFFIESRPDIPESLEVIFLLYVLNTVLSYLAIHKHSILQADQKAYVVTIWTNVFMIIRYAAQILWIILFRTYIPVLIIQLIVTLIGNVVISKIAEKRYKFIKYPNKNDKIDEAEKKSLISKIRAMMLYRIGSYVVNSTDSILISKFIGVAAVGVYSNYMLLFGMATALSNYISSSLTPSIGNQAETQTMDKIQSVFQTLYFMFFVISSITTICIAVLINPFIEIWIGQEYLLSTTTVVFLVINYYILMMRRIIVSYRNALGLYEIAQLKPVIEAIINLVASFILLKYFGVAGVIIGTTISGITTSVWIEPYILYKYYFKSPQKEYWKKFSQYAIFTFILTVLMLFLRGFIYQGTILTFILITILTLIISTLILILIFRRTNEYRESRNRVNLLISNVKKNFKK